MRNLILCSNHQLFVILMLIHRVGYSIQNVSRTRIPTLRSNHLGVDTYS